VTDLTRLSDTLSMGLSSLIAILGGKDCRTLAAKTHPLSLLLNGHSRGWCQPLGTRPAGLNFEALNPGIPPIVADHHSAVSGSVGGPASSDSGRFRRPFAVVRQRSLRHLRERDRSVTITLLRAGPDLEGSERMVIRSGDSHAPTHHPPCHPGQASVASAIRDPGERVETHRPVSWVPGLRSSTSCCTAPGMTSMRAVPDGGEQHRRMTRR